MKPFGESRFFWIALAAVVYPLLGAGMLIIVIMPPLNMVLVPVWFLLMGGAIGTISNGLEATTPHAVRAREARRAERARSGRKVPPLAPPFAA